ncbi:MAG TPA: MBL fold metallo-hydrolase [Candidatus Dormibacteraeota bacterium]
MTELPVAVIDVSRALPQAQPLLIPVTESVFRFEDTCNVYVVRGGDEAITIDFGSGDVLDELADVGVRVTDVFVTHHHRDQVQGLRRAADAGIRIWVPEVEQDLVARVSEHWQARGVANNYNNRQDRFSLLEDVPVTGTLRDYASLDGAGQGFRVIPTPGHTVGSITLHGEIDGQQMAFTGDLISAPGKVWSLAATQWSYNGAEGVTATIASLLDLRDRRLDLLLPSHGTPMHAPEQAIETLVDRLQRLLDLRRENLQVADLRATPYERISEHLLKNRTSHATTYVLLSGSGKALLIDYGYDFTRGLAAGTDRASRRPWLYTIDALKRDFGIQAIDAVIPTHYHDDHVAGCNLLRQVEGTQVWAPETFAAVLEQPEQYDLPCLWYEPITVDRRLPVGRQLEWEEYRLTLHEQPGHTRYAVAIETEIDGKRVLFIGDQMGHADGLGLNYVYAGGFEIGDYEQTAELYRRIAPDLLLSGHWQPLASGLSHFEELARRGKALHELHRQLLPLDEVDLEAHGPVASLHPYIVRSQAGHPFALTVEVRNPAAVAQEMTIQLTVPTGWLVQPSEQRIFLAAGARTTAGFDVIAPSGSTARRARIAADLTVGSRRLGQVVEALVDLE